MTFIFTKSWYLVTYGILVTTTWTITLLAVILGNIRDKDSAFSLFILPLQISQTIAVFDILNSLFGLVSSPIFPTLVQVLSRLHIVWIIFFFSPENSPQITTIFSSILVIAWSLSELIRYPYYIVLKLSNIYPNIKIPVFLKWLRYTAFIILYPIGILSEVVICSNFIYDIRSHSSVKDSIYLKLIHFPQEMPNKFNFEVNLAHVYIAILCLYIPGSIYMYSYMLYQRKKSLTNLWRTDSDYLKNE
ncbi:hypothetical protein cand_001340 [Cryptosporidium andersoni]|uniref:very-long-chain (3R)-3-hydroxyacyl-CoA dehydratase n=1 Tax=Cryptosporidium andersoni TaxID=117008 RepID=A0A1J4MR04_9CRYT|nr:hypothetical protein cand_001340 [Cryptosporidium andersoni]